MKKSSDKKSEARLKKAAKDKARREKETLRKIEIAKRVAAQSERMHNTYKNFENIMMKVLRWLSVSLDKVLFNQRHSVLISFILAAFMTLSVNYNTLKGIANNALTSSRSLNDVALSLDYNSDAFEISGAPSKVDITITGDASSVINAASSGEGKIVADLNDLKEGNHNVTLQAEGYPSSVNVKIAPSVINVTIKKKITQAFAISYDFINIDSMSKIYTLGTPKSDENSVNVRASKDTLSTISNVKALIDVKDVTGDFATEAKLVAYDQDGQVVPVEIVPDKMKVEVPVTSNSKTVPIKIRVTNEVPGDKVIESITSDQDSLIVYGTETNLAQIEEVSVYLDASTINKDTSVLRPITLPDGVSFSSIMQVNLNVKLADKQSKTLTGVKINYINNTNGYTVSHPNNKTTTSVTVYGTQENIAPITASDVNVYIDMQDAKPGTARFDLQVDEPENGLVRYKLSETTYELIIHDNASNTQQEGEQNNG